MVVHQRLGITIFLVLLPILNTWCLVVSYGRWSNNEPEISDIQRSCLNTFELLSVFLVHVKGFFSINPTLRNSFKSRLSRFVQTFFDTVLSSYNLHFLRPYSKSYFFKKPPTCKYSINIWIKHCHTIRRSNVPSN